MDALKDFETSKKEIEKLVKKFDEHKDYIMKNFDEENIKQKFINKFFIALGWDVDLESDVAPQYADVEFEDSIKINGHSKAPDYCFKVGLEKIFFVEAKAPHENIDKNKEHAYQLKRYTWSAKLPLGILTDFEEFAVYEPIKPPKPHHKADRERIIYYTYKDYVENWKQIYDIFSKKAVWTGSFDKYVEGRKGDKKGTATVDKEFLDDIEKWRVELAKIIARKNKMKDEDELNYAVQLIIDRIIFLRIAEDRGIEKYGQLKNLIELAKNNEESPCPIYEEFIKLCKKADDKYNSGLFHFNEEKGISLSPDDITPDLYVSDKVLKEIILGLYYPISSYEFSVISTEILGNIYEQFLGNVIYFTPTKQARVKQKPEVKKAGGVYYTPQFIVKYIVDNTVGALLKGKTPNKVSEMRFVDPACGSGSFLLGVYQKLLDWHLEYYSKLDKPPKEATYPVPGGIKLTINEKKRILVNNIFGVDIDSQAVEVTKLSLLLKVLEGENKDIFQAQQKLIQERVLPFLGDNIRCGNSLVDNDIFNSQISSEEIHNINPFNWEKAFPRVFADGGFDAVIGNPPYVGEKGNKETFRYIKKTEWGKKYYYSKMDLFYYFYHKALDLCKDTGRVSFITTSYFLTADGAITLRNDLKERANFIKIINFNELQVFENAKGQHNTILVLSKSKINKKCEVFNSNLKGELTNISFKNIFNRKNIFKSFSQNQLFNGKDNLIFLEGLSSSKDENSRDNMINNILNKIKGENCLLKDIMNVNAGADVTISKITKKHIDNFGKKFKKGEGVFVLTEKEFKSKNIPLEELKLIKPFIKNSDIDKYSIKDSTKYLIYTNSKTKINDFPTIKKHLSKFRVILKDQMKRYDEPVSNWFMLHRPRDENIFTSEKIILPYRAKINRFAYSNTSIYASRDVFFLLKNENDFNIKYILALLNSKLYYLWLYYRGKRKGETLELYATPVGNIPLKFINVDEQQIFVELADKLTKLNEELKTCRVPNQRDIIKLQIEDASEKIDHLVYQLYELTAEEIRLVEETVPKEE